MPDILMEGMVVKPCPEKMDMPHLMIRDFDRLPYPYAKIHCISKTTT
ncbi:hypothetical protein ACOZ4Y_07625 [Komagataeibacter rhaeticus]|uniref:Uncharacterized protein n=1 Tax=Komagataeibacter rhaeticus TaxID=215221 RepID=A0A858JL41_9PROT|nr:hypothetical protein [Komagataeibacter rhaeticus]MBL7239786.1 hypothetical protein [Komagataeibacter rhaeticus]QIP36342.1 hypothetical protein GWK63_13380 [Komagataeibacter rhaeticus]QOC46106.1 hypothetical protein ICJ78_13455 [Komagataeibacter rhaeticus]WPP21289.1 hypothetical protein SCD25_12825 [Komagataeibacter rhaeticus]